MKSLTDPKYYFDELREIGFRVQLEKRRDRTRREGTLQNYLASVGVNGHLISISGEVYVLAEEGLLISAAIYITKTLRAKLSKPAPFVVHRVDQVTLDDLRRFCMVASSLDPCTDIKAVESWC